jgi:hypothetical protein
MKREQRSPLSFYAELEAKRFSHSELHEFLSVWFPRTAAFAVMRGGTLSAVVPQDPQMDLVGTFYIRLSIEDKGRWDAFFTGSGTMIERAGSVGLTKTGLYDWKDRLMELLADAFQAEFGYGNDESRIA